MVRRRLVAICECHTLEPTPQRQSQLPLQQISRATYKPFSRSIHSPRNECCHSVSDLQSKPAQDKLPLGVRLMSMKVKSKRHCPCEIYKGPCFRGLSGKGSYY
eukprot:4411622-Amphidinium_carterae.1